MILPVCTQISRKEVELRLLGVDHSFFFIKNMNPILAFGNECFVQEVYDKRQSLYLSL